MTEDELRTFCKRITWNGAYNLKSTIRDPHATYPDLLNGGRRLSTGLGKWTHIAMLGVGRHLTSLGLIEDRYIDFNGNDRGWEAWCLTPLGREVAQFLNDHDDVDLRDD